MRAKSYTGREQTRPEGPRLPQPPLSIAPVESGAEVMIERDATTARSDGQLHLATVVH